MFKLPRRRLLIKWSFFLFIMLGRPVFSIGRGSVYRLCRWHVFCGDGVVGLRELRRGHVLTRCNGRVLELRCR